MSVIAETSRALIAQINTLCGDYLKEVAEHPGQWDDSSVRRLVRNPPAVYIAWIGQQPLPNPNAVLARWGVFVVADVLNGQRNDNVGIYQVVETLTQGLHKTQIAPSGLFELQSVQNLWSDTQSGMGVAVYGMYFNAVQPLMPAFDESALDDFRTYHHQFNQSKSADAVDDKTQLTVILPIQGENDDIQN